MPRDHKKSKKPRTSQQQMMPMMIQMPMQQQAVNVESESEASDHDAVSKIPQHKVEIPRNVGTMKSVPRKHLLPALVRLHKDFDRAWLSELSNNGLLAFTFLVCKVKASLKVADLGHLSKYI